MKWVVFLFCLTLPVTILFPALCEGEDLPLFEQVAKDRVSQDTDCKAVEKCWYDFGIIKRCDTCRCSIYDWAISKNNLGSWVGFDRIIKGDMVHVSGCAHYDSCNENGLSIYVIYNCEVLVDNPTKLSDYQCVLASSENRGYSKRC